MPTLKPSNYVSGKYIFMKVQGHLLNTSKTNEKTGKRNQEL
jgi:hypothetical protein